MTIVLCAMKKKEILKLLNKEMYSFSIKRLTYWSNECTNDLTNRKKGCVFFSTLNYS